MAESRWAGPADRARLEAFLEADADRAMFPLSNLARHGLSGGPARHACRFRLTADGDRILGAVALSTEGMVLPVCAPDLGDLRAALAGQWIAGVIGETGLALAVLGALGLDRAPRMMDDDEPHFVLDLADLAMPRCDGLSLHPLSEAPRSTAVALRAAFAREVLGEDESGAILRAEMDVSEFLEAGSHRLLRAGDDWVAMTGFNAALPRIVQIGAVYVPPARRGRGLARAAVALHLDEARRAGAKRAVLFAASEPATRAYRALGFRQIGRFGLYLFATPLEVPPCP
ncbi:GNAT family N-acetyltransferase [Poseidonocella sp. HB161398]|uniref:GNAT family N-acetyltransferase n=1 Tax=Poseidonocella sp. HB161398 TaxID=2320855 RepID=UPI0014867458|nr:GNAT family N-acetyltransferase [Poseidonocella sp. HB161398]